MTIVSCNNNGDNFADITSGPDTKLKQTIGENNKCDKNSRCTTFGHNGVVSSVTEVGGTQENNRIDQTLSQQDNCFDNSDCTSTSMNLVPMEAMITLLANQ